MMDDKDKTIKFFSDHIAQIGLMARFIMNTTLYHSNLRDEQHRNPFNNYGKKTFSQTDEDGLTFEIIRRLGITDGVFAEFGVGDGLENNSLALVASKWRGFWVGNGDLAFDTNPENKDSKKFSYLKDFVTLKNISNLMISGLQSIDSNSVDLLSMDLDGNDIYFINELLKNGLSPKIIIVEYNSKFAPPIEWQIDYDENHTWNFDDYFGASFASYCRLLGGHGYFPVCCNSFTGSNAFFVKRDYRDLFKDVPDDEGRIWCPPKYFLTPDYGHRTSLRTVQNLFRDLHRTGA